ncbi:hypothetical protein MVEN_00693900 [Mycena venus]|uniref:Uncharacterized protein n=1 Tax=Mycena venus TaxID=2733690 RepID=A0A8H7D322_9AGAR|nr:hypothetical protein MVEN_00693900 [Mycena venus]
MIKINSVQQEGELRVTQSPTPAQVEKLLKHHLAVLKMCEDKTLEFGLDWNQSQIDKWLRQLLPLLFEFLDARYPDVIPPNFHWALLGKDQRTLYLMERKTITGAELDQAKGPTARKFHDHVLRIGESTSEFLLPDSDIDPATKHKIPSSLCKNLKVAVERLREGEDLASESESEEGADNRSSRSRVRSKGKSKAVVKPLPESRENDSPSQVSDSDAESKEPSPVRTRSVFGIASIKQESTYDDDYFPERLLPPTNDADIEEIQFSEYYGSSLKRSASPFGSFDPEGSRKRARSASYGSNISISSTEISPGPSPNLRPATSSFQSDPTASACADAPVGTAAAAGNAFTSTWTPPWLSSAGGSTSTTLALQPSASTSTHPMSGAASITSAAATSAGTTHSVPASVAASSSASAIGSSTNAGSAIGSYFAYPTTGHTVKRYVSPPRREGLKYRDLMMIATYFLVV